MPCLSYRIQGTNTVLLKLQFIGRRKASENIKGAGGGDVGTYLPASEACVELVEHLPRLLHPKALPEVALHLLLLLAAAHLDETSAGNC